MCQQASLSLSADPRSAARARAFVGGHCNAWQLGDLCADIVLPVSELVTNSLVHTQTATTVTVSLTGAALEVAVSDENPRLPVLRPVRSDLLADIDEVVTRLSHLPEDLRDESLRVGEAGPITAGRGLLIVDRVADEWGVSRLAQGKAVWFRVTTPTGWSPTKPCRCVGGGMRTPGGLTFHPSG